MRKLRSVFPIFIGLLLLFLLASESFAITYRYRYHDESGKVLYADDLPSVPEMFRDQAMIVSTEDVDEQARQAAEQERTIAAAAIQSTIREREEQQAVEQVQAVQKIQENRVSIAWTIGVFSLFLGALIVLAKVEVFRKHETATERIRAALAFLVLAYALVAYGRQAVQLFEAAGDKVAGIQRKSAERGRKAGQFYKEMEKLAEQVEAMEKEQEAQINAIEAQQ